ncbi:MAG: hypothetical protein CL678_09670 [Bdellovibrionaceae bacterium]|nr:hypothetical protein [Pseudobdellovibrionaceae bacterium]|tara:strand:+ start:644 stop:1003 length:360 start_codon:yes stop_codon:yes gene_type:complete
MKITQSDLLSYLIGDLNEKTKLKIENQLKNSIKLQNELKEIEKIYTQLQNTSDESFFKKNSSFTINFPYKEVLLFTCALFIGMGLQSIRQTQSVPTTELLKENSALTSSRYENKFIQTM